MYIVRVLDTTWLPSTQGRTIEDRASELLHMHVAVYYKGARFWIFSLILKLLLLAL